MKRILSVGMVGIAVLSIVGMVHAGEQAPGSDSMPLPPGRQGVPGRQDGRLVRPLRWTSPAGEDPGTYAEYLQRHPVAAGRFGTPSIAVPARPGIRIASTDFKSVSILVDKTLFAGRRFTGPFDQYRMDLAAEGYTVYTETVSGGTCAEIKSWVRDRYEAGSRMIVFVGDITAAWAKDTAGETFPCDLYYMDVDGSWTDMDHDGVFETHEPGAGDEGPEVCVARIHAHELTYAAEDAIVGDYFDKTHRHRMGAVTQPWRALEYIDDDWHSMDVFARHIFGPGTVRHDLGYLTTGEDYLQQVSLGQYYVQVCDHGSSAGHSFRTVPTESVAYAHTYVYSPSSQPARLWLGADDGIKAWVNGAVVLTKDVDAAWEVDKYYTDIRLDSGWNRLLCKISQEGGDFQFSARVTGRRGGEAIDGLKYRVNDPNTHAAEGEFIRGWLVNGFHEDIPDNFWNYLDKNYLGVSEPSLHPTAGQTTAGKTWNIHSAPSDYVDFEKLTEGKAYGACYAFVSVTSKVACNCQIWMGYDDGAKVWLNGRVVISDNRYGDFTPDMTKVNITLNPGPNRLLVKLTQWVGRHRFSLRFCQGDGGGVPDLTYQPTATPITYIPTWVLSGPYANKDESSRLSTDYLGNEADVRPSAGNAAPIGTWQLVLGDGLPFDIGEFYDHGGWIYPKDVHDIDPPALFYNLFVCGAGRFTDEDYLAGSYIFDTTHGLGVVASTKTGSMLGFKDFTGPLGDGQTLGESFVQWFRDQLPFEDWEKQWFYGMVLLGDPMLHMFHGEVREPLPPAAEGFESGDFTTFPWQHAGDAPWQTTSVEKYSGSFGARPGEGGTSILKLSLQCVPGQISFFVKTATNAHGKLSFSIDDETVGEWPRSGQTGWRPASYPVSDGEHTFTWTYTNDSSDTRTTDDAWLDDISLPAW